MMIVTIEETRKRLDELLLAVSQGEIVVIATDGVWLATLGQPPTALNTITSEKERIAKAEEFARSIAQWHAEDGLPYPPNSELPPQTRVESPAA